MAEYEVQKVSFKKRHELTDLAKSLDKVTDAAIKVLEDGLADKDKKVARQCAITLLEMKISVAKEINADQLQRAIADVKVNPSKNGDLVPVSKTPVLDFNTVRKVE